MLTSATRAVAGAPRPPAGAQPPARQPGPGANAQMTMSDAGLAALAQEEGLVNGLYDDRYGHGTYGVGHLVHGYGVRNALLAAARADPATWGGHLAPIYQRTPQASQYLRRSVVTDPRLPALQSAAEAAGRDAAAQRRFRRDYASLTPVQQAAVRREAQDAVRAEVTLLARDPVELYRADLRKYENAVRTAIVVPLTQSEYEALVSFAFNTGAEGFRGTAVARAVNAGTYRAGTPAERRAGIVAVDAVFAQYVFSRKTVSPALTARRRREAAMFLRDARRALLTVPPQRAPRVLPSAPGAQQEAGSPPALHAMLVSGAWAALFA